MSVPLLFSSFLKIQNDMTFLKIQNDMTFFLVIEANLNLGPAYWVRKNFSHIQRCSVFEKEFQCTIEVYLKRLAVRVQLYNYFEPTSLWTANTYRLTLAGPYRFVLLVRGSHIAV